MPRGNIFRGKDMPKHARRHFAVSCAKTAEPIEMLFGLWFRVGPKKHVLGGVHSGPIWRIPLNRRRAAAMRPSCQITKLNVTYLSPACQHYDMGRSRVLPDPPVRFYAQTTGADEVG